MTIDPTWLPPPPSLPPDIAREDDIWAAIYAANPNEGSGTLSEGEVATLQGFYPNPPTSSSAFPNNQWGLARWSSRAQKLMPTIVFLGDSITNFEVGPWDDFGTEIYADGWVPQLAALLAPQGVIKGYGLRGFHKGAPEWVLTGTWTQIASGSSYYPDADVAPFGDGWTGTGASTYATWTNVAPPSSPGFDVTMQCIEVTWIDVSSVAVAWSYSVNGSSWVNGPAGGGTNNLIKTTIESLNIPPGGTFTIQCANAAGTSVTTGLTGVTPWTTWNGPNTTYEDEDIGLNRVNLGYAGLTLNNPTGAAAFYRPTSGSSSGKHGFDVLDTIQPDLIVMMFRNDYGLTGANVANWTAGLEALIDYCANNSNWANGGADFLIWSYWPDNAIVLSSAYPVTITFTGSPTGGSFDFIVAAYGGPYTASIGYSSSLTAATVQSDLQAMNVYAGMGAAVVSGPNGGPFSISNIGINASLSVTNSLTGGSSPNLSISSPISAGLAQAAAFRSATKAIGVQYGVPIMDEYDYCSDVLGFTTIAQFENILDPVEHLHPNQYGLNLIAATLTNSLGGPVVQEEQVIDPTPFAIAYG
jgi:hypothetical protein